MENRKEHRINWANTLPEPERSKRLDFMYRYYNTEEAEVSLIAYAHRILGKINGSNK